MPIKVVGISHHQAPVAVREFFSLNSEQLQRATEIIHSFPGLSEALILSTCNRTELYALVPDNFDLQPIFLSIITQTLRGALPDVNNLLYQYRGRKAIRHLFCLAAGLDSQLVGEYQILGQIKKAYSLAVRHHNCRFLFNKLFHRSFTVGKRVRSETEVGRGAVSVSHAAVHLAQGVLGDELGEKKTLVIGAGKNALTTCRQLLDHGVGAIKIANRNRQHAIQLADQLNDSTNHAIPISVLALENIAEQVAQVDIIISSTNSPCYVLTYADLADMLGDRSTPLVIIDIAMPRDAEPQLAQVACVTLFTLDDLDHLVNAHLQERCDQVPLAQAIVEKELDDFHQWMDSLDTKTVVAALHNYFDGICEAEAARQAKRFCPQDQKQLHAFAKSLTKKLLAQPTQALHDARSRQSQSELMARMQVLLDLFAGS